MNDAERFWAKVDKTGECWEWTGSLGRGGYGKFGLNDKIVYSHRYSYVLHHPITIDLWEHRDICVCHRCDNPKCINPAHLFLGSRADNMKDKETKGRGNHPKGEKAHLSKLTETQVREIRKKYVSYSQLALEYDVCPTAIGAIIRREVWKHI